MSVYTEDRETFERQMLQPPHAARLMDHAGRFIGRLSNTDKDMLLKDALDEFWARRDLIKESQGILLQWVKALEFAAKRRPRWHCWWSGRDEWVKGTQLGKQT